MAYVERHTIDVVTGTGGGFTGYTPVVTGAIAQWIYTPVGTTAQSLEATTDLDIVGEVTGLIVAAQDDLAQAAIQKAPRQPVHTVAGVGLVYSSAAPVSPVVDVIRVANERLKLTIAQGGAVKTGQFIIWIG